MERKKEKSRAAARDIPAICPAVMVDIERDVPGKTAERIWQSADPQMAWQQTHLSSSSRQVANAACGVPVRPLRSESRVHGVDHPHDDSAHPARKLPMM